MMQSIYCSICFCSCILCFPSFSSLFFFNDTATTEIYPLSLHDALPICLRSSPGHHHPITVRFVPGEQPMRSEEHTSELQSHLNLVCRLLLEKKKTFISN